MPLIADLSAATIALIKPLAALALAGTAGLVIAAMLNTWRAGRRD